MRQITEFEDVKVGQVLLRIYTPDEDELPELLMVTVTEVSDGDVKWLRVINESQNAVTGNGIIYESGFNVENYVSTYVLKEAVPTPEENLAELVRVFRTEGVGSTRTGVGGSRWSGPLAKAVLSVVQDFEKGRQS